MAKLLSLLIGGWISIVDNLSKILLAGLLGALTQVKEAQGAAKRIDVKTTLFAIVKPATFTSRF
jgi:hypothetical protein